jgi:hypothetical protein
MDREREIQKERLEKLLSYINTKLKAQGTFVTVQPKKLNPEHIPITKMIKEKIIIHQRPFSDWKPEGIWASGKFDLNDRNYTWFNFCYQDGMYDWIDPSKNDFYTFKLKKSAKIYLLESNHRALKKFMDKYRYYPMEDEKIKEIQSKLKRKAHQKATKKEMMNKIMTDIVAWERLEKDGYDGIYFPHYRKFAHVDEMPYWFSSIDVTSICIWNPAIIQGFKKISLSRR